MRFYRSFWTPNWRSGGRPARPHKEYGSSPASPVPGRTCARTRRGQVCNPSALRIRPRVSSSLSSCLRRYDRTPLVISASHRIVTLQTASGDLHERHVAPHGRTVASPPPLRNTIGIGGRRCLAGEDEALPRARATSASRSGRGLVGFPRGVSGFQRNVSSERDAVLVWTSIHLRNQNACIMLFPGQ